MRVVQLVNAAISLSRARSISRVYQKNHRALENAAANMMNITPETENSFQRVILTMGTLRIETRGLGPPLLCLSISRVSLGI